MSLTLSLRQAPPGRISLFGITPDQLAGRPLAEIEKLPLAWGRDTPALGEFFKASGVADGRLIFDGCDQRFCDLGGGMSSGECEVLGDAGDFLGRDMRGGRLVVRGSVGRFAASGLSGGEVHVGGNVGDRLGAALPWLAAGMRGGRVVVAGSVGERCGDKMRRGEIFIAGDVGAFCATRMVAGSVIVAGRVGAHAGYGMRRGTLLLLGDAYALPATFAETAMAADTYLRLVWRDWLARFDASSPFAAFAQMAKEGGVCARRWMGDIGSDGRGEVIGFGR
jgi:formylmethanofuran dehydrogenase subunit C